MHTLLRTNDCPERVLAVRIHGPNGHCLQPGDRRRLFAGSAPNAARDERLASLPRIEIVCDSRVVGLATFDVCDGALRATDIAIGAAGDSPLLVAEHLLRAIELVATASGCQYVVLLPFSHLPRAVLVRGGYRVINEGCAGGWAEKALGAATAF